MRAGCGTEPESCWGIAGEGQGNEDSPAQHFLPSSAPFDSAEIRQLEMCPSTQILLDIVIDTQSPTRAASPGRAAELHVGPAWARRSSPSTKPLALFLYYKKGQEK